MDQLLEEQKHKLNIIQSDLDIMQSKLNNLSKRVDELQKRNDKREQTERQQNLRYINF